MKTAKTVKNNNNYAVINTSSGHVIQDKSDENNGDDEEDYGDDECDDIQANIAPMLDTCLASHEFEWLTPTSNGTTFPSSCMEKDQNAEMSEERNNTIASAAVQPQPQDRSLRKTTEYRQKRPKDREYPAYRMSPTPCYDTHMCHHRMSPMRSSWCCPSPPPPPHVTPMPVCMHHSGNTNGMDMVPLGQEFYNEDHGYLCYCLPPSGRQHGRYNSSCACRTYGMAHYGDCSPSSPQHAYRAVGQKSQSLGTRRRDYSPSSSPLHRPYCSNDLTVPPRNTTAFWDDQWKPSMHSEDINSIQKIQQLEADKKNLQLQVSVLSDQVDAQAEKIQELEGMLNEKKGQLHQIEQTLHQEIVTRSTLENTKLELLTEISNLRLRLTAAERDRKESDEKYRRIENSINGKIGDSDMEQYYLKNKISRNAAMFSQADGTIDVEKLRCALESVMASNDEKERKIEDLNSALKKYKKLQEYIFAGQQNKIADFVVKETHITGSEFNPDTISLPRSPLHESSKVKFVAKPPTGSRTLLSLPPVPCDCSDSSSVQNTLPQLQKSSSMENVRQLTSKTPSPKSSYGTVPRQSGPQALQNLQEQLQSHDCVSVSSSNRSQPLDCVHGSPVSSNSLGRSQRIGTSAESSTRMSRNKSSGVSFGKGFFKLRLGKRSSSAPELAPFESVSVVMVERDSSSASPTPQPTMQPFFIKPEKDRSKNILKFFTKWKRSGSQNIEKIEGDFRRGGIRATAGPRLGWSRDISIDFDIPFTCWNTDIIVEWFHKIGLSMYVADCKRWRCNGQKLLNSVPQELEKELNIKNPLHKKKLALALQSFKSDTLPACINSLDYQWVVRWLDDVGLPQYKDSFSDARVDGRVLHYLTVEDLLFLKVTNQLHHVSIKRGIQVLREKNFYPHCLIRRSFPDEGKKYSAESVALWTNHRVMEWLRTVDLSEYAPNLRGSGVHGALIIYEPKFNSDLFATLLNIPPTKTLLRRHLATHFKTIVGPEFIQAKRDLEAEQPLTPNIKIKQAHKPQFALKKKKKGKGESDNEDFICPMDIPVGSEVKVNGEKLMVRRNSDPAPQESRLLNSESEKNVEELDAMSEEITSLTVMLQEEKLLKNAPTTNV